MSNSYPASNARWSRRLLALAVGSCLTGEALAGSLVVIEERGPTVSVAPYFQAFQGEPETPSAQTRPHPTAALPAPAFPIRTAGLKPGRLAARAADFTHLPVPLFIVGADPLSEAWLTERRAGLRAMSAVGMVIQASSAEDVARLQRLVPELPLTPLSGDDLARTLGLTAYPALITRTGVVQ